MRFAGLAGCTHLTELLTQFPTAAIQALAGEKVDNQDDGTKPFQLDRCRPVYEAVPGWAEDVAMARKLADLPAAARRYIDRIGELVGLPVAVVSVGPDRDQTIHLT